MRKWVRVLGVFMALTICVAALCGGLYAIVHRVMSTPAQAVLPETVTSEVVALESEKVTQATTKESIRSTEQTTASAIVTSEERTTGTEAAAPVEIRLIAVGDNLMHQSVSNSGRQPDGSFSYANLFSHIKPIASAADIAVINQECVMGGIEYGIKGYPSFNTVFDVGHDMVDAGFNVVLGANNHIMDIGSGPVTRMIHFWKNNYPEVSLLGIAESPAEKETITVIEKSGIKIAMLNYTCITNNENDYRKEPWMLELLDYDLLTRQLKTAREQADFIIVFPHWGDEYSLGISDSQREQTEFLAEQGVDLVIGAHPHVIEPVEWINRPDGGRMLVYYSLGNFVSIQAKTECLLGGLADITVEKRAGKTTIKEWKLDFLVTDYRQTGIPAAEYYNTVTTYLYSEYNKALCDGNMALAENPEITYDAIVQLKEQLDSYNNAE